METERKVMLTGFEDGDDSFAVDRVIVSRADSGDRAFVFVIADDDTEGFALTPDQARQMAARLFLMADKAERSDVN